MTEKLKTVKDSNIKIINPNIHKKPDEIPLRFGSGLIDPAWMKNQKGKRGAGGRYNLITNKEIFAKTHL